MSNQETDTSSKPWVLITGASSGIGEAFAKRFGREGWNVILVARSGERLERLAEFLERETKAKTMTVIQDLTEPAAGRRVFDRVQEKGIEVEGLINNAGFGVSGTFAKVPLDRYLNMIDLLVRSLVELTHLFLARMLARKRGLIINVSSTASFQPLPYASIYAASKSFVTSFTEALWLETRGSGVRVFNLCPGVTKTDFGMLAGSRDFRRDLWAEEVDQVMETAFRTIKREIPTAISGWRNQLIVFLERFIPHRILLELIWVYQRTKERV